MTVAENRTESYSLSYYEKRILDWALENQRLPTQREIAASTGLAVTTVNNLLGALTIKGVLVRTKGGQYAAVKE